MSIDENRQLIRRFFAEIGKVNLDAFDEICAEDYALIFPGIPEPLDVAGTKQLFGAFLTAFPGLRHRIKDTVAGGDRVATRLLNEGRPSADFQGIPATGKEISLSALNIFRISDGRIAEHWVEYNPLQMLEQLGVSPVPPAG